MPKESLKDKLDGNELDLGLSNLTTVPVKDLAALPKATVLDLSNNVIATLPDPFCSLTHLVKIDLSKNLLTQLPDNFGNLRNLQHLDLLGNKLSVLPLSFSRLDRLKWLDLKDNPLEVGLKKNAGDCLNEAQCKRCAQNILRYMKDLSSQLERIKQEKLQKEREQEAQRKEKEEEERKKMREERKAEKERKRQQSRQKYQSRKEEEDRNSSSEGERPDEQKSTAANTKTGKPGGGLCAKMIVTFFLTIIFMTGMIYIIQVYCDREKKDKFCKDYGKIIIDESNALMADFDRYFHYIKKEIERRLK